MRTLTAIATLCLLASPASAKRFKIEVGVRSDELARCLYRTLRSVGPGQVRMTSAGASGDYEILREASGVGSSVFMWRVDVERTGSRGALLRIEAAEPLLNPDGHEQDIMAAIMQCSPKPRS